MESLVVTLRQNTAGAFRLRIDLWSDGAVTETLLDEESSDQPELGLLDVWETASQMVDDRLVARFGRGLWARETPAPRTG